MSSTSDFRPLAAHRHGTVVCSLLPTEDEAKEMLQDLGVPREDPKTGGPRGDLVGLWCTLDRLGSLCGRAGLHYFLTRPHHHLAWRSPADVLAEDGGVERVRFVVTLEMSVARGALQLQNCESATASC
jgi:hypothetical protein